MHLLLAIKKKKINWRCLEGGSRLANWEHWPCCAWVFGPPGAPGLKHVIPNPVGFDYDDHRIVVSGQLKQNLTIF